MAEFTEARSAATEARLLGVAGARAAEDEAREWQLFPWQSSVLGQIEAVVGRLLMRWPGRELRGGLASIASFLAEALGLSTAFSLPSFVGGGTRADATARRQADGGAVRRWQDLNGAVGTAFMRRVVEMALRLPSPLLTLADVPGTPGRCRRPTTRGGGAGGGEGQHGDRRRAGASDEVVVRVLRRMLGSTPPLLLHLRCGRWGDDGGWEAAEEEEAVEPCSDDDRGDAAEGAVDGAAAGEEERHSETWATRWRMARWQKAVKLAGRRRMLPCTGAAGRRGRFLRGHGSGGGLTSASGRPWRAGRAAVYGGVAAVAPQDLLQDG